MTIFVKMMEPLCKETCQSVNGSVFREFQLGIWMLFMIRSLFSEQIDLEEAKGLQNLD